MSGYDNLQGIRESVLNVMNKKSRGRPKKIFSPKVAERALIDLEVEKDAKIVRKLESIAALAKYPIETVAAIARVSAKSIVRWHDAYEKDGIAGLRHKPGPPRRSKLSHEQKTEILAWIDGSRTSDGEPVQWTLARLRQAVHDEFGVTLAINAIWKWARKEGRTFSPAELRQRRSAARQLKTG